jgi:uncharacterized repeat protein (TIGR01451 family)
VNDKMSKETKKITMQMLTVLLVTGLCLLASAPAALAAAPALKLTATSQPTNFIAGSDAGESGFPNARPAYTVIATNVGSAPTTGPTTFTDTLPVGLTATIPLGTDFNSGEGGGAYPFACNVSVSGQTVTCTDPHPLPPGEWAQFLVPVKVDLGASGSVVNQANVVSGSAEASATTTTAISSSIPSFGFVPGSAGFSIATTAADGQPATQVGSRPYALTLDLGFPSTEVVGSPFSAGHPKDLKVSLPRGVVANPNAIPARCTEAQLEAQASEANGGCPVASQAGVVVVLTNVGAGLYPKTSAIYNMAPPPGVAAEFAFNAAEVGIFVHLRGGVNSAGEYELGTDTHGILALPRIPAIGVQAQLWGTPSDPSHDPLRGECVSQGVSSCTTSTNPVDKPFLTMPSSCRPGLTATTVADSWENPSQKVGASAQLEDPSNGAPVATSGCNQLDFKPTIAARPSTNLSDSPTGLDFNLHVPQTDDPEILATANVKDVKVTFPAGVTVNPSSANGLGACSSAQIGLTTAIGQTPIRFDEEPASCPDAAKVGSVEVHTPLLDHPLSGGLYIAKPFDNPFNSFLAVYIAIHDAQSGVVAKLAGRTEADPQTGRLVTTFSENPEIPFEDFKVSLFGGSRAPLKTPLPCGTHKTVADITPWSTPEGANVNAEDSFATSVAAAGSGICPASEAAAPHAPSFSAGTITPQAGAYSPFVLKLSREDGTQRLAGFEATLPKGLIGKIAGIPYCSEAQIAAAKAREAPGLGALEQASPSCPAASEVGTVTVGAGAGATPFYAQGRTYLAGPYKGAQLSVVIITPAVAGPFDLGAVVSRAALRVDSETAQVRIVSDPLPTIMQGIPLDVRSIVAKVDRPNLILNPTSCDPMSFAGSAVSVTGQSALLSDRFQVGGCKALKFAPKLKISLKGGTKRTKHPALKAVLTYPKGHYANTAYAQVTLPHSAFLDQAHIGTICTRVQFAANACPKESIYGFAKATTPILDKPVKGPVYLRSSNHKLPDLVLALDGQIDVDVVGKIDSGKGGGIRTTFEAVPDAPVSKVTLEMKGGKKGLLINSENLCAKPQKQKAIADFTAQNGKVYDTTPLIANDCGKKAKKKKKHRAR